MTSDHVMTSLIMTMMFHSSQQQKNITSFENNRTALGTTPSFFHSRTNIFKDPAYLAIGEIQKFMIPILCVLGLVGNLTSVAIFLGSSMKKNSFCMYLMTKCITDTIFLGALFVVWLEWVHVPWFHKHGVCQMVVFITYVCGFLSVWLVVMVTMEDYIRICHPNRVTTLCTAGKARAVLLTLGVFSIFCYNFPLWTTHSKISYEPSGNKSRCSLVPEYAHFNQGLTYFDTAVTLLLPFIIVLGLMCRIFGALVAAYQRNKRMKRLGRQSHIHFFCLSPYGRVTAMLLAVPVTFLVLHTPSHMIRLRMLIGQLLHQYPTVHDLRLQRLFEILYYSNYVTNWVTYYVFGKSFRELYKLTFCSFYHRKHVPEVDGTHMATNGQESPAIELGTIEVVDNTDINQEDTSENTKLNSSNNLE